MPCFLLFGPTDPAVWAPQNAGVRVLHEPAEDLQRLTVDRVWDGLTPVLEEVLGRGESPAETPPD